MRRYFYKLIRGWLDVRKSKGENDEIAGWKRSKNDKLAGIGAECGGVTRGESVVYLDWEWSGQDRQRD